MSSLKLMILHIDTRLHGIEFDKAPNKKKSVQAAVLTISNLVHEIKSRHYNCNAMSIEL